MSHTFTSKPHQGKIQKEKNKEEEAKAALAREEQKLAESWAVGAAPITGNDLRKEKQKEIEEHKKQLKVLYEKEMEA